MLSRGLPKQKAYICLASSEDLAFVSAVIGSGQRLKSVHVEPKDHPSLSREIVGALTF